MSRMTYHQRWYQRNKARISERERTERMATRIVLLVLADLSQPEPEQAVNVFPPMRVRRPVLRLRRV